MELPNSLEFAGVGSVVVEIVDVHRHAAEKLHAMTRSFGDRENSRVRDLVDLVILIEHDLLDPARLLDSVEQVWREREFVPLPERLPEFPESWPRRYELAIADLDVHADSFVDGAALVAGFWAEMSRRRS